MPRREQPLESGDDVLRQFAGDLRQLREKAGSPTYRQLSARAYYSAAALSEAANGRQLPSLAVTLAYVSACDGDTTAWEARWKEIVAGIAHEPIQSDSDNAPYVGLGAFQIGDSDRFFGRDKLITDLLTRVRERRFLGVFGASGSGKSSVLRAGLTARLIAAGHPAVVITPGPHPIEECAVHLAAVLGTSPAVLRTELAADPSHLHLRVRQALADRPADVDLLLVVDQFEELFTLCADRGEREWLITALTSAALAQTSRARVVLGVRADFYGHCGQFPQLLEALRDAQVLIGPMDENELRQAITEPAIRAGLRVETALVSKLIAASAYQTGDLPLVSHALLETWRRRRGTTLTLAGYEESGGIAHAVSRTAEEIYASLDLCQQTIAKQIFLRLTALGEGTEDTKRRIDRGELDNNDPNTGIVLESLAQARLITLDRDSVEIAHEALIRHWPRLHDWLAEDRDGLRIHRQLTDATAIWHSLHRDPGALYRGARLALAEGWATTSDTALTPREHEFLSHSLSAQAHDQAATRRRARRLRQLVALLTVLLLLATATTVFAIRAQQTATEQRTAALAQKVLREATALSATNPALARQLALAAYRLDPTKAARDTLYEVAGSPYATVLPDHASSVFDVAVSHDGRILATATLGNASRSRLRNISDPRRPRDLPDLPVISSAVAFSPRAPILATVQGGKVRLWDLTDPQHARELANFGDFAASPGLGSAVAFGPDGRVLATADADRMVRLWNIADPHNPILLSTLPRGTDFGHTPGIGASVAFSPDGHILAVTARDRTARLWDLTNPRDPQPLGALPGHTDSVMSVAFSPDGKVIATASQDATARLWNVADPRNPALLAQLTGHSGPILATAFSRAGGTLATASEDRTTRLWNVADPGNPSELTTVTGHNDTVFDVAFSPDGRTLITASGDTTARLEDISALVLASHADSISAIAASPAGDLVATSSGDRTIRLWDFADPNRIRAFATLRLLDMEAASLSFSSDGYVLAVVVDATVRLWDISDPNKPRDLAIWHAAEFTRAGFGPTGRMLAMGTVLNETTQLLDASDPNNPREVGRLPAMFVAFSPDGRVLTSSSQQGMLQLWNIADPNNPRIEFGMRVGPGSVAFSPSGRLLAIGKVLVNTMRLWDIADPQRGEGVATIPVGAAGGPAAAFSPDGSRLVTSGADRTARVWNVSDPRHPIEETTLRGHAAEVRAATFIPGTNTIATADADHVIRLWETDIERLAARVCDIAYPRITPTEWDQHFPGLRFQPPCP